MKPETSPENMKSITVMIPADVSNLLTEKAKEDNLSRSDMFRRLLAKGIRSEYKLQLKNNQLSPISS